MNTHLDDAQHRAKRSTRPRWAAALAATALTAGALVGLGTPANAGSITSAALAVSSNVAGATGVSYAWTFTPATTEAVSSITLGVPTDTQWPSASAAVAYGITGTDCVVDEPDYDDNGEFSITLTDCDVTAGRPVSITINGVTNGAAVTGFQSAISTGTDSGDATAIEIAANTTAVTVLVPQSLTFTNDTTAVALVPIPGGAVTDAAPVTLTVATNAHGGYALRASMSSLLTSTNDSPFTGGDEIPSVSPVTANPLTGSNPSDYGFGAKATVVSGGATLQNAWNGTTYLGYETAATTAAADVVASTEPAELDEIVLTNGVRVPGIQPAGTYTGTVTYTVTPSW